MKMTGSFRESFILLNDILNPFLYKKIKRFKITLILISEQVSIKIR